LIDIIHGIRSGLTLWDEVPTVKDRKGNGASLSPEKNFKLVYGGMPPHRKK